MKISLSVIILIILGIVAAGAAAMFTATLSAERIGDTFKAEVPDITILVAASEMPMMTPIREEDVVEKNPTTQRGSPQLLHQPHPDHRQTYRQRYVRWTSLYRRFLPS